MGGNVHKTIITFSGIFFCYSFSNYQSTLSNPNIILILSDDQGWGGTSVVMDTDDIRTASDFFLTPNLEKLAERGMRFTNGYTCHPNCSPTRASILTGKTPARLHSFDIVCRVGGSQNPGLRLVSPRHAQHLDSHGMRNQSPAKARWLAIKTKSNR